MNKVNVCLSVIFCALLFSCSDKTSQEQNKQDSTVVDSVITENIINDIKTNRIVNQATSPIVVDGVFDNEEWGDAPYFPMNFVMLGKEHSKEDFQGEYKLKWDKNYLYVAVHIIDDSLIDHYEKWDTDWWNDDCVEIFIDENRSKGDHQFNHNAFAYHIGLNGDVVDLGEDKKPHLYNKNLVSKRTSKGKEYFWEFAISIYKDDFNEKGKNVPVTLTNDKEMGFMIAYCDTDTTMSRENFIGSEIIEGEDKDRGWIDAGEFGTITLK